MGIGPFLLVPSVSNAVRAPLEGIDLDGQTQTVEDFVHRSTAHLTDLPRLQFGGNAMAPQPNICRRVKMMLTTTSGTW